MIDQAGLRMDTGYQDCLRTDTGVNDNMAKSPLS